MATVAISKQFMNLNAGNQLTLTSVGAGDTFTLDYTGADYKTALLIVNSSAASDIVIEDTDSYNEGIADLTYTVAANKTALIVLDSGYYKKTSGDSKGKVVGTASKACSMALVELP